MQPHKSELSIHNTKIKIILVLKIPEEGIQGLGTKRP